MPTNETIIAQTTNWLRQVVVGCNFCPFAKKELNRGSIHFEVARATDLKDCAAALVRECERLDSDDSIETTLIVYPDACADFNDFLDLIELAENALIENDYEGIYQVASFHPDYCFEGAPQDDPANYTNRSLYPMLHLLREDSLTDALENYPNPEGIPKRNIAFARKKGLAHMKALQEACRQMD